MGKNMSKKNIIFLFFLKFATFHSNFQEYNFINLKKKNLIKPKMITKITDDRVF